MATVLVVAAHPDDELLGCAGTVARHVAEGDTVHVQLLAEGATARDVSRDAQKRGGEVENLFATAARAAKLLGAQPPRLERFHDNRMDGIELLDVIKRVERLVDEIRPDVIYTHHGGDLNVDHQVTHQAVLTASRPLPGRATRAVYTFETLSSTEWGSADQSAVFAPVHFVDISAYLDKKLAALRLYEAEMRPFPHPRSFEAVTALARVRGSRVGVAAAEAFGVVWQRT